jgi:E3 ubiquitin-protein ligase HERC2
MFVEFVRRDAACDPLTHLPTAWLRQLEGGGLELLLLAEHWPQHRYVSLIAFATARIGGPRGELVDVSPRSLPAPSTDDQPLAAAGLASLQVRLALLQMFNRVLLPVFSLAWTGNPSLPHTLGAQLTFLRQLIFLEVKQAVWGAALDSAAPPRPPAAISANPPPTVTVNRRRALKERLDRRTRTKNSVFVQLHNQIRALDRRELMRRERAFKVKFAGEAADDHGGPYREVFTVLASELHREDVLPLLLLCPNGQHNLGSNRDRFLLNPGSSSAEQLAYFEFLGMVLGFALLQKETAVTLSLCSVVWKQLVHEPLDVHDLAGFDEMMAQSLHKLDEIQNEGIGPDDFDELIFESFTTVLSHGAEAPLCEGGADMPVTFHNRRRYCELVRKVRLEEGRLQAQTVLKGINTMVPASLLPLFTHREIELMVCGAPDIDLAVLRQHTRYGVTVDPAAPHMQILWQVLAQFSAQQRTLFLSFIWSRTRLPATEEDWAGQCMKLHTLECPDPDGHLPVSHTCFFSMEWPRYSTVDVAKRKLLYAITNCTDIDADHTAEGRANMAMSAEEEL